MSHFSSIQNRNLVYSSALSPKGLARLCSTESNREWLFINDRATDSTCKHCPGDMCGSVHITPYVWLCQVWLSGRGSVSALHLPHRPAELQNGHGAHVLPVQSGHTLQGDDNKRRCLLRRCPERRCLVRR